MSPESLMLAPPDAAPVGSVPPPFNYDDETALVLFRRLRGPIDGVRNRDRASLRDHLILSHAPLVEHCARGLASFGEPVEDLVQEGYVGLIKAVDRFDPEKGVQFSTYSCHLIAGEMRHYLRDLGKLIHEPGWHSELRSRITRANEQLSQQLTRPATPEEIAQSLNIPLETVRDVQGKTHLLSIDSLDAPRESEDGAGESRLEARLMDETQVLRAPETQIEDEMLLEDALPQLRELEHKVVRMFFFEEKTKTEIARALDISVNYAAYLVKKGVDSLRGIIEAGEAPLLTTANGAQQAARAAYLLSLAKGAAPAPDEKRRATKRATPIPAARSRVSAWAEWAVALDEEVARGLRYGEEFGVLWLNISNWDEATARLDAPAKKRALETLKTMTRKCCRAVDKVGILPPGQLPGLHLLVLMPRAGDGAQFVGTRWAQNCRPETLYRAEPTLLDPPQTRHAFALFPRDAKGTEEILSFLSERISQTNLT